MKTCEMRVQDLCVADWRIADLRAEYWARCRLGDQSQTSRYSNFWPSMIFSENRLSLFRNHARMIVAERRYPLSGNALKGGGP